MGYDSPVIAKNDIALRHLVYNLDSNRTTDRVSWTKGLEYFGKFINEPITQVTGIDLDLQPGYFPCPGFLQGHHLGRSHLLATCKIVVLDGTSHKYNLVLFQLLPDLVVQLTEYLNFKTAGFIIQRDECIGAATLAFHCPHREHKPTDSDRTLACSQLTQPQVSKVLKVFFVFINHMSGQEQPKRVFLFAQPVLEGQVA